MKKIAYYIPILLLVAAYTAHGVLGLLQDPESYRLVSVLGFDTNISKLLVYGIFPLDVLVALLLIFGDRISTHFPWKFLFLWAGIWPWFPRLLEYIGGYEIEFGDALLLSIMAVIAYRLRVRKGFMHLKPSAPVLS